MRFALLFALVLCISTVYGYERLWAKGDVLLSELQNGKDELHVVVFYDSTNNEESYSKVKENQAVQEQVLTFLKEISAGGKAPFPTNVFYATVDSTDPYNQNLIYKVGIDPKILKDGPAILTLRHGTGFRQNGPKVDAALRTSVDKLRTVTPTSQ